MNRRDFVYNMLALPATMSAISRLASGQISHGSAAKTWDASRSIRFVLNDALEHPFYWWPRTLLTYPITFTEHVELSQLALTRTDTKETIPFQFSEIKKDQDGLQTATLNFFSDLPSGAQREFILSLGATVVQKALVSEHRDGVTIVLDSGAVRVRIPASQLVHGSAPGPLMQFARGDRWFGSSELHFDGARVLRITTTRIEHGPLLLVYEVRYEIAGGSHYTARIQCTAGLDFISFREDMEGLKPGLHGTITSDWTDFGVTHRQAPNHPFPSPDEVRPYDEYAWQRIDDPWRSKDIQYGASIAPYPTTFPQGQVPIILGIFQTWTPFHIATWANFWNQHSNDAVGIFIDKTDQWQDHEYAYEVESPALQVSFFHQDGKFVWKWPLKRGRRSTCVTFYDHDKDKKAMHELEQSTALVGKDGTTYHAPLTFTSHTLFLQNRYGTLDLNCVKDWVLEYPEDGRRPATLFTMGMAKDGDDLEKRIMNSDYIGSLPLFGTRENGGHGSIPGRSIVNFSPVPTRQIQSWWVDGFNRFNTSMTARQRKRLTAIYLFVAYIHAGEEFMPMVPMLSGHPNFLADVKGTPGAMAFLFPDHPMASTWADLWEKFVELNTRFNTRPAVQTWQASGGRWTEDLGTYVWAFLRPALQTEYLLRQYDGRERFLSPQLAMMAEWLVNTLTAPFDGETAAAYGRAPAQDGGHEWGVLAPGKGPQRVHPPQGAHSERRVPPRSLWYLGDRLQRYAPLAAEHAMWAARPTNQDMETTLGKPGPWDAMYRGVVDNRGTKPQLRSEKFTGYGIVLRGAIDTRDEVSIHLQQIDQGPNYRWGVGAEGGCGVLYFFAGGKSYSHNGPEDVGDRKDQDTDFCTNFGVYKNGGFRSIGENVLSRPFYNLGMGQFAEIVSREGEHAYSGPEYVSRSVMLAGSEYFVVYDALSDPTLIHRLSWFVRRGDALPTIKLVRGGSGDPRSTQRTDHQTDATTGVWFDGVGDSMAVVSHRSDIDAKPTPYGCRVNTNGFVDMVFQNPEGIHFREGGSGFDGTSGLIRTGNGRTEFALFHGTHIAVGGLSFTTTDTDLGIGGVIVAGKPVSGEYFAPRSTSVRIEAPSLSPAMVFYMDGAMSKARREAGALVVELEAGQHRWELTDTLPVPIAPQIVRTENRAGGARVVLAPVAAATGYRIEVSNDNEVTWTTSATGSKTEIDLVDMPNGKKVHLRAVSFNTLHESAPSSGYPLYVTNEPPPSPDGLRVELSAGAATITWGEVLGAGEYRLYVRTKGEKTYRLLFKGLAHRYEDRRAEIKACHEAPGPSPIASDTTIFEYAVAAVNGNGEGQMSASANTDPSSWRNWNPKPHEAFRRVYSYAEGTTEDPLMQPRYYPN